MRICTQCWVKKPTEEYDRSGRLPSGQQRYRSACKACCREIAKRSRARIKEAKLKSSVLCPACGTNLGKGEAPFHKRKAKQNSSELFIVVQDIQELCNSGAISHPLFVALSLRASIVLRKIFGRRWKGDRKQNAELQRRWIVENNFKIKVTPGHHS